MSSMKSSTTGEVDARSGNLWLSPVACRLSPAHEVRA
jgi:hypothetical protein